MVESGQVAVIHFTGRIAEGDSAGGVFDTTNVDVALEEGIYHDHRDYKPLEVRVGEGNVLPGVDRTLQEMAAGDRTAVELEPAEAFGERRDERVVDVPTDRLEADGRTDLNQGALVRSDNGETGWVLELANDRATVDFNHELAGTTIECELHVLDVRGSPDGDDGDDGSDGSESEPADA